MGKGKEGKGDGPEDKGQDVVQKKEEEDRKEERIHIHGDKRLNRDKTEITSSREAPSVTGNPGRQCCGLQPI